MRVKEILKNRTKWMPSSDYEVAKPVVSVLLPTWKRAENGLFEAAVRSVLDQSLEELELIIVDDCSTDGTFDIIQRIMREDPRVSCIRHTENVGLPAISEFEAYQKSRGTYLAFMFDDNEWEPDAIEQLVEYAQEHDVKALAGQYMLFQGRPGSSYDEPANWSVLGGKHVNISDLMITNSFGNGAVLLHRETVETVGFLDPNVALSRLWDWDLWQRISKEFRFEMVDIMVGREKGIGLEDSLGNTHQLYQWAAQERMHQPRNQELLAENYQECDVFDFALPSSPFLYRSNCWLAKQYEKKPWFNLEDTSLRSIEKKSALPWKGKRITYLTASPTVNASSTLNWGRLPYSEDYVLYYSCIYYFDYCNWLLADAIVIERDLSASVGQILDWAKKVGIPCYYYIDDNFTVLAKDYEKTFLRDNMKQLARGTSSDSLSRFRGVFCSTAALREYFQKQRLHQEIALMEPVYMPEYVQPYHALGECVNVVFFGSFIRGEVLIDTVYPALERIAEKQEAHLYCPNETFLGLMEALCKKDNALCQRFEQVKNEGMAEKIRIREHLTLHSFPRTLSLELALKRFSGKNIQIQIHCGPVIENDRYKTVNALLNAVCLGAVLVATDDLPYSAIQSNGPTCLLAENTEDAWEDALRRVLDPQFHRTLYQNAQAYCQKEFDAQRGKERLTAALWDLPSYDFLDLNKRLFNYIQYLNVVLGGMSAPAADASGASAISQGVLPSSLFLNSLSGWRLVQTLRAALPGWVPGGSGVERLLPLKLSKPLVAGSYTESRLPRAKKFRLVLATSDACPVVFEYVSENRILKQELVNISGVRQIILELPEASAPVRLRIANHHRSVCLYVLQRQFFSKNIFDVSVGQEGIGTDE